MASISSPYRTLLKPLILKFLGPNLYQWFQYQAKIKDIKNRLLEEPEMDFLPQILLQDDYSLDIGANYAYYSVRLAELCPKGRIFSFEPVPSTKKICEKILKHYKKKNVSLYQKGVGRKNETIEFQIPLQKIGTPSAGQAHLIGRNNNLQGKENYHPFENHETVACEVVSIDEFLPDLPRLDFVKIDIEGAEYFALEGMRASLKKHKPIVLMEICPFFLRGFGIEEENLKRIVQELGYDFFVYNIFSKKLDAHNNKGFADGNYLLVHKENRGRVEGFINHGK